MGQFPARITDPQILYAPPSSELTTVAIPVVEMDSEGCALVGFVREHVPYASYGSDLYYLRSEDHGATWSQPGPLRPDFAVASPRDNDLSFATDGRKVWLAVWTFRRITVYSRSEDGGLTWTLPTWLGSPPPELSAYDSGVGEIASDGKGVWAVVWSRTTYFPPPPDLPIGGPGHLPREDHDVLYSKSTDDGRTWSPPANIDPAGDDTENRAGSGGIASDGNGHWLVLWSSDDEGAPSDGDYHVYVARSSDHCSTWEIVKRFDPDDRSDERPHIYSDQRGNWLASWHASAGHSHVPTTSKNTIFTTRSADNGDTWVEPPPTLRGGEPMPPTVIIETDGKGYWVAVWSSDDTLSNTIGPDRDILVSYSQNNGATWSSPVALNTDAASDNRLDMSPSISTDKQGHWIVVWSAADYDNGNPPMHSKSVMLARFTFPDCAAYPSLDCFLTTICGAFCAPGIGLAIMATGLLCLRLRSRRRVFPIDRFKGGSIRRRAFGASQHGVHCCTPLSPLKPPSRGCGMPINSVILVTGLMFPASTSRAQFPARIGAFEDFFVSPDRSVVVIENPQIQLDSRGRAIIVWSQADLVGNGRVSYDSDLYVRRSFDAGVTWSPAKAVNGDALSDDHPDDFVALASDGKGALLAVWTVGTKFGTTFALRKAFARSDDWGETWSMPSLVDPAEGQREPSDPYDGAVATNGSGVWIATWIRRSINRPAHDFPGSFDMPTYDFDFVYSRSVDDGKTWSTVVPIYTLADHTRNLNSSGTLVIDESGTWLALWTSIDGLASAGGSGYHIVVATSNDDGADWTEPHPIDPVARGDSTPRVAADGHGNLLATWSTSCDWGKTLGTDPDVMASLSTERGATWRVPTALNTNAVVDDWWDYNGDLATDGKGNWVAVWESNDTPPGTLGGDFDIYISHSSDNGTTWTTPMAVNGDAPSDTRDDIEPRIATDGQGNWIVIWVTGKGSDGNARATHDSIKIARFSLPDECATPSLQCLISPSCGASCASGLGLTFLCVLSSFLIAKLRLATHFKT